MDEKEKLVADLFAERIMPLAALARERGVEFFPLGFDDRAKTYYVQRDDNGDYIHEIDEANLVEELGRVWQGDRLPEITALAEPLLALAEGLREKEETSEDVSPFIYAMF
jgi:hypothetical protein